MLTVKKVIRRSSRPPGEKVRKTRSWGPPLPASDHYTVSSQIVRDAILKHIKWVRDSEWKNSAWLLGKRTLESRYGDQKLDFDFVKNLTDKFEKEEKPR